MIERKKRRERERDSTIVWLLDEYRWWYEYLGTSRYDNAKLFDRFGWRKSETWRDRSTIGFVLQLSIAAAFARIFARGDGDPIGGEGYRRGGGDRNEVKTHVAGKGTYEENFEQGPPDKY